MRLPTGQLVDGPAPVRRLLEELRAMPRPPLARSTPVDLRELPGGVSNTTHGEGGVDLYIATQWLHVDRDQVAESLDLPPEKVRLTLGGVGGAFGGREDLSMQIHACMLALHTNRPVRMAYNREESFYGHVHRHPCTMRYEHGATKDGDLVYVRARVVLDGGAYASMRALGRWYGPAAKQAAFEHTAVEDDA